MTPPSLRVTRRCLGKDLALDGDLVKKDAREFKDEHDAVGKFVSMRGAEPAKGEAIHGVRPRGLICSLHVGSARAVTTWDAEENVCWLLAYNDYHRNGEPDDAFEVFLGLHADGDLLPTENDYDDFFADDDDNLLDELLETGRELLDEARQHPGYEALRTWRVNGEHAMCVDVVVDGGSRAEEGWMGLTLPEGVHLSDEDVFDMAAQLIPPEATPIYSMKFRDRDRRPGEVVYRWEHYE